MYFDPPLNEAERSAREAKRADLVERLRAPTGALNSINQRYEAADEIERLRAACDAAFMAMCDYRDNGDAELFKDAIDALGLAALINTP
jgi:hypothetical protein